MMPVVSVIMPAFNAEKTIAASIDSVLMQTMGDWELIICDDKSTDNTVAIIEKYAATDLRVRLVDNHYEKSAAGARNSAIDHSSGRYIAFLDSDDLWHDQKLEKQLVFMKKHNVAFCYTDYRMFTDVPSSGKDLLVADNYSFGDIVKYCNIGCLTVMLDRTHWGGLARFPFCKKEDYALWVILLKEGGVPAKRCPGVLSYYRKQANSISSSKHKELLRQYRVLCQFSGMSFPRIAYSLVCYSINGFVKHFI
ncbi:glycosyltransferase family 2 protein [Vogesella indigofera]|uniref:glycosyltransferase family 2 protein n=1 Tax=Vogesella indigofera TaxID=45465 RepID=UPI00234E6B5B|nr:glycosyltransferase family 2 protein [Vogesella indigofera]MDC7706298.1 glycosyltransferase [Vogesella indigofera]